MESDVTLDDDESDGGTVEEHTHLTGPQLAALYRERFDDDDLQFKADFWRILCDDFFQRYVRPTDTVVDLGAGSCEFINAISCGEKIAVDLNPDTERFATGAKVIITSSTDMHQIGSESVDVVFTSNFFEHLPHKPDLVQTLLECHRILRPGGRLLVLMPNFRTLPGRYWDYFDHHLPLTHHSLAEVLGITGFDIEEMIPRFLPYTIKYSRIPRSTRGVRIYLRLRPAWLLFGRQMFAVATRRPTSPLDDVVV
jgi:SAM-dependent methyltransferase